MNNLVCKHCGKAFVHIKARQFCSRQCADLAKRQGALLHCLVCDKEFYRQPAKIKLGSRCCSHACENEYRRRTYPEIWKKGKEAATYKDGIGSYARETLRERPLACEDCGKTACFLHVHHLDENRHNNAPDNLRVLCVPCHYKKHPARGNRWGTAKELAARRLSRLSCNP